MVGSSRTVAHHATAGSVVGHASHGVAGRCVDKAAALRSVLNESFDPLHWRAQVASGQGTLWFVDTASAQNTQ